MGRSQPLPAFHTTFCFLAVLGVQLSRKMEGVRRRLSTLLASSIMHFKLHKKLAGELHSLQRVVVELSQDVGRAGKRRTAKCQMQMEELLPPLNPQLRDFS